MKIFHILFFAILFFVSCGKSSPYSAEYNSLLEQGHKKIPNIKKIEEKFDSVSYIVNLGHPVAPPQWRTKFYISGWYQCDYNQKFEVVGKTLVFKGEAELSILEVTESSGNSKSYGKQVILRGDDLTKFMQTGFDLEKIGFSPSERKTPPPIDFMKYYHEIHP